MKNGTTAFQNFWIGFCMLAFAGAGIWSWVQAIVEHNLLYVVLCPLSILFFGSAATFCFWLAITKLPKKEKSE